MALSAMYIISPVLFYAIETLGLYTTATVHMNSMLFNSRQPLHLNGLEKLQFTVLLKLAQTFKFISGAGYKTYTYYV